VPPFIPGHEGAGIVAALGPGVTTLKEGDRVGIAWLHDACGGCEYCVTGWETLCPGQRNSGYSVNGSFAEYAIGAAPYLARLPREDAFAEIAPILCADVNPYKGNETGPNREWLAISGLGGLGHIAVQYAKAMGMHVVGLDVAEDKLALARRLGADVTVDARSPDAAAQVRKETGGGTHGVLVTAVSPSAFAQAVHMVRRKGTVVLIGLPPGDFPTFIFDVVLRRIQLRGSIVLAAGTLPSARLCRQGKVRARSGGPLWPTSTTSSELRAGTVTAARRPHDVSGARAGDLSVQVARKVISPNCFISKSPTAQRTSQRCSGRARLGAR
jgi:propanol-preferring alcohol dehydrogenase